MTATFWPRATLWPSFTSTLMITPGSGEAMTLPAPAGLGAAAGAAEASFAAGAAAAGSAAAGAAGSSVGTNGGEIGEISQMLYDTLTGIQWGRIKDEFNWTQTID